MAEIDLTNADFEKEVIKSDIPVIVDFWASWCGPCKMTAPELSALAKELDGKVKVCKVNVDKEPELAAKYNVMSIPTILFFKNGNIKQTAIGYRTRTELKDVFGL